MSKVTWKEILIAIVVVIVMLFIALNKENGKTWAKLFFAVIPLVGWFLYSLIPSGKLIESEREFEKTRASKWLKYLMLFVFTFLAILIALIIYKQITA